MLLIVRGLPGSGKTTYAKQWAEQNNAFHVEADMFFVDSSGRYTFDGKKIGAAHDWCQLKAAQALERGENVVVSNTFSQMWEMAPYEKMTKVLNVFIQVYTCREQYQNVHGVPEWVIQRMRERWEKLPNEPENENAI